MWFLAYVGVLAGGTALFGGSIGFGTALCVLVVLPVHLFVRVREGWRERK